MPYPRLFRVALLLLVAAPAYAQMPPDDRNIEIQLFEPALGEHAFLTVAGAEIMSKGQFQLALGVNYLTHPFSVFIVDNDDGLTRNADVVSSVFTGSLSFAIGISSRIQAGIMMPAVLSMEGDGLDASTGMPEAGGLSVRGLGDARLEVTFRLYERSRSVLSIIPAVTVPTSTKLGSDDDYFLGDNLPTFRPRVAWQWTSPGGKVTGGANLGVIIRKQRTLYSSDVGQQLTYGLAGALHLHRRFDLIAEVFGRKGFAADLDESPLELDGALKLMPATSLAVLVGGGAGIVKGVGAPAYRVFAGVSWTPDYRDSDRDGISNMNDKCPNAAEDKDTFQDADGCPDNDNDGDSVGDDFDKCAADKEDLDGFQDEDGCPEFDNDSDGINDENDGCPEEAEDKLEPRADDGCPQSRGDNDGDNVSDDKDKCPTDFEDLDGFQDDDGCPDNDNDSDAILDRDDKCPDAAEDKDGFQDEDGCPDLDNDNDGVADTRDRCPKGRETINGVKDDDGCADKGGKVLARVEGNKIALAQAIAWDGKRPRTQSRGALEQLALVMRATPAVGMWRVAVVADKQALAEQRAEELKDFLTKRGVPASRLETVAGEGKASVTVTAVSTVDGKPVPESGLEPVIEVEP